MFDFMLHREGNIIFSVKRPRYESDCATRHKFSNENHATPPCVRRFSPDVETQIHFFEITVQRDRKTEKTSIEKQKSDNADERLAVFIIDLGARRNEPFNQSRIYDVIQHRQITPVGGKKWFHSAVRRWRFTFI